MPVGNAEHAAPTKWAAQMNQGTRRCPEINCLAAPSRMLAEWTGLEPATPGVTGRYSNQLNYHSRSLNSSANPARSTVATG